LNQIKEKIQKSQSEAAKDEFLSAISTTIEEANIVQRYHWTT
jgi:hypothetical protein